MAQEDMQIFGENAAKVGQKQFDQVYIMKSIVEDLFNLC